ncbi:MAG: hypothetical protein JWO13_2210 [Acidobacteriales bacterium]|nr:hypothetical protein [Terriglobales bacterium]
MALITIESSPEALKSGTRPSDAAARDYCRHLELGDILFIPGIPFDIPQDDLNFLLQQEQSGGAFHKNVAYRTNEDRLTGFAGDNAVDADRTRSIMRAYSQSATKLLSMLLAPYTERWKLDYASYRPLEEDGRDLSLHKRNDLLHTDAFPSRPTNGDRILRFFTNINPAVPRKWMTTSPFDALAQQFAGKAGGCALPKPLGGFALDNAVRGIKQTFRSIGIPVTVRSPYDDFMLRFHNFLKENGEFQKNCPKEYWDFPPNSCWMVYTDMTSHAVLSGQYALEQTYIVSKDAMVTPEKAPVRILEKMVGAPLVS